MIKIPPNLSPAAIIPRWSAHHTHYWVLSRSGHNGAARLLRLLCRIPASLSIMITLYHHSLYHHSVYHDHSASHHCTISLHSVSAPCMCVRRHTRCSTEVSPRPALLCPAWPSVTGGCSAVWCGPSTITSTGTSCTAPTPGFRPIAEETRGRGDGGD